MRIAIRADASAAIGTGHIRRCLSLGESLRDAGAEVAFLTRALGLDLAPLIRSAGFALFQLPSPGHAFINEPGAPPHARWAGTGWREDAAESRAAIESWRPDVLILDHYAFDASWIDAIRPARKLGIVVIDDLGDRALSADIIVDHNYSDDHAYKHRISAQYRPRLMGGPRYALLSRSYQTRSDFVPGQHVTSVGVFMGGSDIANATEAACGAVRSALGPGVVVNVVSTGANPHLDRLRRFVNDDGNMSLSLDLPDLAAFFARHDLQIGAGGGATWERCCVGAPTIAIAFADNHVPVLEPLETLGVLRFSRGRGADYKTLAADIGAVASSRELRAEMSRKARALVDGRGTSRVVRAIMGLVEEQAVIGFREARDEDSDRTFAWRNHPEVRRYFHDPRELKRDEHERWWRSTVKAKDRHLLIALIDDIPAGVLRFDMQGEEAEVSIYLDPARSGHGLGRRILEAAADWATAKTDLQRLTASIKDQNLASIGAFEGAGFMRAGHHWVRRLRV